MRDGLRLGGWYGLVVALVLGGPAARADSPLLERSLRETPAETVAGLDGGVVALAAVASTSTNGSAPRAVTNAVVTALPLATNPVPPVVAATSNTVRLAQGSVERLVNLALECVHREYPSKVSHVLQGDGDALPPRRLTPAFYGCYDWHSAVHGHWLLARAARLYPDAPFAEKAKAALERSLTSENIAGEVRYLRGPGRSAFERPYGLAWLLQLGAELREWEDPQARAWAAILAPLELEAVGRLRDWLPKLTRPIRSGEHTQTAFALGLMLDWARLAGEDEFQRLVETRAREFYAGDRICPLGYEPSGEDFLSPCLAEADLMRRVLPADEFAVWLAGFLPSLPTDGAGDWLVPGLVTDPSDPKLAHLDGLNLSRAWMLEGMAAGLPPSDARRPSLLAAARVHRELGLRNATGAHYEGAHWIGTFALYLVTGRGLPPPPPVATGSGGLSR